MSSSCNSGQTGTVTEKRTAASAIWLILALLYVISPADIIPDIPVIGWIDDFFVIMFGIIAFIISKGGNIGQITRNVKTILVSVSIAVILLIITLIMLIAKLV